MKTVGGRRGHRRGNTAIDCATVAKRLGAEHVTMVYRRTEHEMTAYPHEYEFVTKKASSFVSSRNLCACWRKRPAVSFAFAWNWVRLIRLAAAPRADRRSGFRDSGRSGCQGHRPGETRSRSAAGLATENGFIKVNADSKPTFPASSRAAIAFARRTPLPL